MNLKQSFKKYFEYHQGLEKSEELLESLTELIEENDPRVIEIMTIMVKVNNSLVDTIETERQEVQNDYKVFNNLFQEYKTLSNNHSIETIWSFIYLFALVITSVSLSVFGKEAIPFISNVCFIPIFLRALFIIIPVEKVTKYVFRLFK